MDIVVYNTTSIYTETYVIQIYTYISKRGLYLFIKKDYILCILRIVMHFIICHIIKYVQSYIYLERYFGSEKLSIPRRV